MSADWWITISVTTRHSWCAVLPSVVLSLCRHCVYFFAHLSPTPRQKVQGLSNRLLTFDGFYSLAQEDVISFICCWSPFKSTFDLGKHKPKPHRYLQYVHTWCFSSSPLNLTINPALKQQPSRRTMQRMFLGSVCSAPKSYIMKLLWRCHSCFIFFVCFFI